VYIALQNKTKLRALVLELW